MGNLVPLSDADIKAFKDVTGMRPPRPKRRRRRPPMPILAPKDVAEFRRVRELFVPWETYLIDGEVITGAEMIGLADALVALADAEAACDEAAIDRAVKWLWRAMAL